MIHNGDSFSLSALVLANRDDAVLATGVLASHGFEVIDTDNAAAALEFCRQRRFDLAVCDAEISGTMAITANSWSRPRVTIGLLPSIDSPTGARLQFVLSKPLKMQLFSKTVRAAFAPIAADRRLTIRKRVCIKTSKCRVVDNSGERSVPTATVANLSSAGMCLQAEEMLPQQATVEVVFALPGGGSQVRLGGQVVWTHSSGQCGIKFSEVDRGEQRKLENWLDAVLPVVAPHAVAERSDH